MSISIAAMRVLTAFVTAGAIMAVGAAVGSTDA